MQRRMNRWMDHGGAGTGVSRMGNEWKPEGHTHTHTHTELVSAKGGGVRVMDLSQLLSYSAPTQLAEGGGVAVSEMNRAKRVKRPGPSLLEVAVVSARGVLAL